MRKKLSVAKIADKFNVTKAGVYYWIDNGLPFEKEKIIGKKPRKIIDPDDVYDFLGLERKTKGAED